MDIKELRKQTPDVLQKMLAESLARLQELRFQLASHQVKQVREIRALRRDIARIRATQGHQRSA